MKVILSYEPNEEESMSLKISLPKTWKNSPLQKLQTMLVTKFNEKHRAEEGKEQIKDEDFHLERTNGAELPYDGIVKHTLDDNEKIVLIKGKAKALSEMQDGLDVQVTSISKQKPVAKSIPLTKSEKENLKAPKTTEKKPDLTGTQMCKNFGCQKRYKEDENTSESCRHHRKPPIFHETRKYWACCPDKIAWDWDTFTAIPGCKVSFHSSKREGKSFMGGTDVRKAQEEKYAGPQRIDGKPREVSSLEKISTLRRALVSAGFSGSVFDDARDKLKDRIVEEDENVGKKVWDEVFKGLVEKLETGLKVQVGL
eukprot:maker-scaffold_2-snap-gene-21.64-mRNA-1 protein AED:0.01 eAED:0.01 QI:107/1/1/1/1/1/3/923/310